MEINYYRKLKNIDRLSRMPKLRQYNLIEHSYMVTILFRHFASKEDVPYDMVVLDYVMHHDILEAETGDLPYDIKCMNDVTEHAWRSLEIEVSKRHHQLRRYTDVNIKEALTPLQFQLFKICDTLDLWIFLKEEEGLGNRSAQCLEIIATCERMIKGKFISVDKYMNDYQF